MKMSTARFCAASLFAFLANHSVAWATTIARGEPAHLAVAPTNSESTLLVVPGLEEPLVPTGRTIASEDEALRKAIGLFQARAAASADFAERAAPLENFLRSHPASPWSTALLTNLGLGYYHAGYFSRALKSWEQAWKAGRTATDPKAKAVTDRAVGELARMRARVGHAAELEKLLTDIGDRPVSGAATELLTGAREGLWMFRHEPEKSYLCGSKALRSLLIALDANASAVQVADEATSGPQGLSLSQVGELASKARLRHRLIFRNASQPIPVPSVINWKLNHYAAIVDEQNGVYRINDPTLGGGDLWVSKAAIDSESTGYFLVPTERVRTTPWRTVRTSEASRVYGTGFTLFSQPGATTDQDARANQNGGSSTFPTSSRCSYSAMCQADAFLMLVSLNLNDQPIGYAPQKGPPVFIRLSYNQREASQPANFSFFNVSSKWTLNVLSYVQDDPARAGQSVTRYVPGGGLIDYGAGYTYDASSGQFSGERQGRAVLVRIPASGPVTSYEVRQFDGSKLVYARADGATSKPRRVFLTRIVDPAGNALTFNYDSQLRLTSITDATQRNTTFAYGATNPLLVTRITDPFGRRAELTYDSLGRLSSITDVVGLTSSFTYDASGMVRALTTPYGTSNFVYGGNTNNNSRYLEMTDPMGYTQRIEFAHNASGIHDRDTVVPAIGSANWYLHTRNTFVWDKHLYPITHTDYTRATIYHWLHNPADQTSPILESTKAPLESRVWRIYPGQPEPIREGSAGTPAAIGRVLDDGTTQAVRATYNAFGLKLSATDPIGRQTIYTYGANNVDLLTVQQKTSATQNSTVASFTYNAQHLPVTSTDASGATTRYSYNTAGQLTSITNALSQTTRFDYDSLGRVTTVTNANNAVQQKLTYDSADRVRTRTDSEGYVLTYAYDNLDRVTQITYPDGTSTKYVYDRLDLASVTDRLGRTTRYGYDANRQLISVTDPLNHATKYAYYENGALKSLTDPNGNVTSWDIDIQGRPIARTYPDGRTETYTYENRTSRLKSRRDALGQVKSYTYSTDDRVRSIQYTGAVNPTPNVAFTYDPYFPRLAGFADGIGTTSLSYHPIGTPGALKLASEDGPYAANDTVSYVYDALGRVISQTVDSATESYQYDAIGRVSVHSNDLGSFFYDYLGDSEQVTNSWLLPGQIATSYQYDTNTNDRRLLRISTSRGSDLFLSSDFISTPEYRITSMTTREVLGSAAGPTRSWAYGYDNDDRLLTASVSGSGGNAAYTYTYDPTGNITRFGKPTGAVTATHNNRNQLTALGSKTYRYDANGNLLADGTRNYAWDAENRLVSVALINDPGYVVRLDYDGIGRRLAADVVRLLGNKRAPEPVTGRIDPIRYLWCGGAVCQARDFKDAVTRRYYSEGESHVDSGKKMLYVKDQLGSTRHTLNASTGERMDSFNYDPYGNITSTAISHDTPDKLYAGMLHNSRNGFYMTRYRMYDPNVGRWISPDPIREDGGINLYAYVGDNPISNVDPSGEFLIVPILVGGVVGGAIDLALQLDSNGGEFQCVNWSQVGVSAIAGAALSGLGPTGWLLGRGGARAAAYGYSETSGVLNFGATRFGWGARQGADGSVTDVLRFVERGVKTDVPGIAIPGGANAVRDGSFAGALGGVGGGATTGGGSCECN